MGGTTILLVTTSVIVGTAEGSGRYNLNTSHLLWGDVEIYCARPPGTWSISCENSHLPHRKVLHNVYDTTVSSV